MKRRAKKGSVSWWIKKLDKDFSLLVREKGSCEWCGRTKENGQMHCSHIITRTNKTLRWDIFNAVCMCGYCHRFKWHENPLEGQEWFISKFPERYDYLMKNKNKIAKRTPEDYEKIHEAIKNKDFKKLIIND